MLSKYHPTFSNMNTILKSIFSIKPSFTNSTLKVNSQSHVININAKLNQSFTKLSQLNHKIVFSFSTSQTNLSLIHSLQQYKQGSQALQKGQYPIAIRQFQMAFKFLPKELTSGQQNGDYKVQYQDLLKKLLQAHVMMNKPLGSFRTLYAQYIDNESKFGSFLKVLQQLQNEDMKALQQIETDDKLWKELVRAFAFKSSKQCFGKHINIQKVHETKDLTLKYTGLYLYEKIKARKNKQREDIYLNTCRELLKQTEQFQPEQIVKPLSLMACNLLAGEQYLQAEGLMSHCLSVLEQFYHNTPMFLKTDQEHIMCKLLMARVFEGVRRNEQASKIREQYEKLFDEKKLLIQQLTHVAFRQL